MNIEPRGQHFGLGLPDQAVEPHRGAEPTRTEGRLGFVRAEVTGGIVAGMISVPASMGYAILAFAPLGPALLPDAVRAGLLAIIVGCTVALLSGGRTTFAYAPRSVVAFLISALLLQSSGEARAWAEASGSVRGMFVLILTITVLAGIFQALFGVLRIGRLVKYIPAPAIAGFQNAAAALILGAQFGSLLGFPDPLPIAAIVSRFDEVELLTMLVGVTTCAVTLKGARLVRGVSPTLLGITTGTVLYYGLAMVGFKDYLGPVIGKIPTGLPDVEIAGEMARMIFLPAIEPLLPTIIGGALSIAVVASLDGMLCARIIAADARKRIDGNRELVRLGVGNAVSPLIGGMALGINLAASFAAQRAGARTSWSVAVHGVFVIACMLLLPPIIEIMPRAVIAGMLSAVAIQLVDRWTLRLIMTLLKGEAAHRPRMLVDLGIVVVVAVIAIAVDLVLAVFLGVSVAVVFFLMRMSRSVVRRSYRGDQVRSRIARDTASASLLAYRGIEILVLELEGALFFGTAERLDAAIERQCASSTRFLILDLKRVQDIDSTGARVLQQVCDRFARDARFVLLAGVPAGSVLGGLLGELGLLGAVTADRRFPDADRALEWAEDRILLEWRGARSPSDFPLGQLDLLHGMEEHEVSTMRSLLRLSRFQPGEVLFRAGDPGSDLFVIVSGRASATLELGAGREVRLIAFAAGTAFGELGLLDQESRSATITADGELICYVLGRSDFVAVTRMYPGVAIKLLRNLSRELSYRLRWANRTVFELDH